MDFFNSVQTSHNPTDSAPGIDGFAKAIQDRFGPQSSLFTPLPMLATPSPRHVPTANSTIAPTSSFEAITPKTLPDFLARSQTLVLDIRPHHAFSTARVISAISFSVPSTLLKRPLFSTERLGAMLSSNAARTKFAAWADHLNILVYDADSASIPPTSNINGLLQKFRNEGYTGNLAYISGGFQAVWRERRELTTSGPPPADDEEDDDSNAQPSRPSGSRPQGTERPMLRTKQLPISAFSIASTTASHTSSSNNPSNYHSGASRVDLGKSIQSANPFFDSIRQNVELSQGVTERIPLRLPSRLRRRIPDIPFPWLQNIARHAAPDPDSPPIISDSSASETEGDVADEVTVEQDGATEALAMQFYRLELAEQRRLQAVMDFHSSESRDVKDADATDFPYSITAGIEKGAKNRYRHIWPFEHARVRLQPSTSPSSDKDDYVNASYVQPLGTNKRYIATQGPLDATFADFWMLVWQQNVHVIVMLTREIEGSLIKCGRYWADGRYGHLVLNLVSESGDLEHQLEKNVAGGASAFFSEFRAERQRERQGLPLHNRTIKRVFRLRHEKYPEAGERRIIQLQYLGWPDMTVPDDPRGIVQLIRETDAAIQETDIDSSPSAHSRGVLDTHFGIWSKAKSHRPVLLHCSAGVGRTGGFIAVDAILDALRREFRQYNSLSSTSAGETTRQENDSMDVDPQNSVQGIMGTPGLPRRVDESVSPTPFEAKTRQWAERVSESTRNEAPLNPNRHTPAPRTGFNSSRLSEANKSSLGSEERSSAEFSRLASGSSSMTSFLPLTQAFPSFAPGKTGPEAGSQNEYSDIKVSRASNTLTHDRSRAFSTPSSGPSGFFGPLRHRASVSSVIPGPHHMSPPTSHSSSPAPVPQSASGSGSSSSIGSLGCGTSTMPRASVVGPLVAPGLIQMTAENSSSNPSVISSRSPSPLARATIGTSGAHSSSSSNPSLPLRMKMPAPMVSQPTQQLATVTLNDQPQADLNGALPPAPSSNYTQPRALHEESTDEPLALSSYDDPILTVLQDMREQRMSLCQSLRQYVFVHAAVIEGAIQLVDEERTSSETSQNGQVVPMDTTPVSRPDSQHHEHSSSSTITTNSAVSTGKRGASPTELPIEDKRGGVRLAKRPSVKKKTGSDESYHLLVDSPLVQTPKPGRVPTLGTLSSSREGSCDI